MERLHIALNSFRDCLRISPLHCVTWNSRVHKSDSQFGIASEDKLFHVPGVKSLRRDAIAVEHDGISIVQCELLAACRRREHEKSKKSEAHQTHPMTLYFQLG